MEIVPFSLFFIISYESHAGGLRLRFFGGGLAVARYVVLFFHVLVY